MNSLPLSFVDDIEKILTKASKHDLKSMNEANTKAVLIEKVLDALGWDTSDPAVVDREYKTYDNSFLDYALLVADKAVLFCEAKPASKNLEDPKWVSQTLNYANNEGVQWCLLTDGQTWRVFKANEPVAMDKKLAFEVHLSDLAHPDRRDLALRLFGCLTPAAVAEGELNSLGVQVFIDGRVRDALAELLEGRGKKLVDAIRTVTGTELTPASIKAALTRVTPPLLDALAQQDQLAVLHAAKSPAGATPTGPPGHEAPAPAVVIPVKEGPASATGQPKSGSGTSKAWAETPDLVAGEPATHAQLAQVCSIQANKPWQAQRQLAALMRAGLLFAGEQLTMTYRSQQHHCTLREDGRVQRIAPGTPAEGAGTPPESISTAAKSVTGHAMNGWVTWTVDRPAGPVKLATLRSELASTQ